MPVFRFIFCITTLLFFAPSAAKSADTLTSREIRNLTALTHLVGSVKYFYPNRHTAQVSWETVLVRGIPAVRRARTDATLANTLDSLFRPLVPAAAISAKPKAPVTDASVSRLFGNGPYYFWEHHGLGLDKTGLPVVRLMFRLAGLRYASTIRAASTAEIAAIFPSNQRYYSAWLTDSIHVILPLVLSEADYQRKPRPRTVRRVRRLRATEVTHRLTTVMLTWNIIEHFYPYRAVLERAQWSAALPEALRQAAEADAEAGLLPACRTLLARLPDRHVGISPKTRTGLHIVPPPQALRFTLIDSQVVVKQSPPELRPMLTPGTELMRVNGQPVSTLLTQLQATIPATSPAVARQLAAESLLTQLAASASTATLTLRNRQDQPYPYEYQLSFRSARGSLYRQPPAVQEVAPGIFYLDAGRLRYADFQRALPQLQAARGLVVDLRQRPTYDLLRVLPHLSATAIRSDSTAMPLLRQPGFRGAVFLGTASPLKLPQLPLLTAPKVFLTGPHTYSYGETIAELVHRYHLGLLLGQRTGGTNGEMNFAAVGRAYQLSWTGRRVVARGPSYQGTGIVPNVVVTPTLAHLIQEQDAELSRAIEWLRKQ